MGLLVKGQWQDRWYDTEKSGGEFVREDAQLRNWITADGSPGPGGEGGFAAEADRYHLYVSLACPWAHRTLIFRKLKGLEDLISVSVVSPYMHEHGWTFNKEEGSSGDALFQSDYLHQVYTRNKADYTGRVTVPLLWDKQRGCVVSNESSEIIRMFNSAFDGLTGNTDDYYPLDLRGDIDATNDIVYENVNNGVYRAGFATQKDAYEHAYERLFSTLEQLERRLAENRYLCGDRITEADWRLFTTLVRFDPVYHGHFKCNKQRLADYPNLWGYVRELYQWPGVAETVDFHHIKTHYYASHDTINPTGIVPKGPELDYSAPHHRG
ncbi:glutathione S-transferase family protein [Microbulbifer flavimaris]|uniref:Glutathione S-transferase family protein n=1 Tax=Microbulbifer flavimaris TaxID=1781068 RepID=A0ABX4I080_9GAMM|nr:MULTISPECIES: glutathione S-transferase family protein [Microbulbifer]KUJ83133.1 glutathione-dependent reductase [Microbulbifer sp. ZGT114]PCO05320.1 glutathione S-transferase family protein [Microbulbifer flavimaris]